MKGRHSRTEQLKKLDTRYFFYLDIFEPYLWKESLYAKIFYTCSVVAGATRESDLSFQDYSWVVKDYLKSLSPECRRYNNLCHSVSE